MFLKRTLRVKLGGRLVQDNDSVVKQRLRDAEPLFAAAGICPDLFVRGFLEITDFKSSALFLLAVFCQDPLTRRYMAEISVRKGRIIAKFCGR